MEIAKSMNQFRGLVSEKSDEMRKSRITKLIDVPYPRKIWDDIRKGNPVDFYQLVKTGMVLSIMTPFEDEMELIKNGFIAWGERNKNIGLVIDLSAEQKWLDRYLEFNRNNGKTDFTGLNELLEKICLYSSVLSEHKDGEHPSLASLKIRVIEFESFKGNSYYIAISSHSDLIEDSRLKEMMDDSRRRFEQKRKEWMADDRTAEPVYAMPSTIYLNINGPMINSNIQIGTIDSVQNQIIQQNDLKNIDELIRKLEKSLDELSILDVQKEDLIAHIEKMKVQITSKNPNRQTVASILNAIKDVLQTIPAGQTIVTEIITNGNHILKALGIN